MKNILIINGPNLNFTGVRQKNIYGDKTIDDINDILEYEAKVLGVSLGIFSSNSECKLIDELQEAYMRGISGIIINPGALTHYSYALMDAIDAIDIPVVEVHLSNIYKRAEFWRGSVTAKACIGLISGLGYYGYILALKFLSDI